MLLVTTELSTIAETIWTEVEKALPTTALEGKELLRDLIEMAPHFRSIKRYCEHRNIRTNTLEVRFYRARLPAPRIYLTYLRLLYVAALARLHPKESGEWLSRRIGASSEDHVKAMLWRVANVQMTNLLKSGVRSDARDLRLSNGRPPQARVRKLVALHQVNPERPCTLPLRRDRRILGIGSQSSTLPRARCSRPGSSF